MAIERAYHDDGTLRSEGELLEGKVPHGLHRDWHPNGVLAEEVPYNHGIIDGTVKQWNDKGELIAQCEIKRGNGVLRQWTPFGWLETTYLDGKWTGRQRGYRNDGAVFSEAYWLENTKVSKKRYLEACKKDPRLPSYEGEPPVRRWRPPKSLFPKRSKQERSVPTAEQADEFVKGLLEGPHVREALSWLEEMRQPSRSLGEATDQDESIRLVKKLYRQGAVNVHAVEIHGEETEDQNTGRIVVELPQDEKQRRDLFKSCGKFARDVGYDPEKDMGQRFIFVMLD